MPAEFTDEVEAPSDFVRGTLRSHSARRPVATASGLTGNRVSKTASSSSQRYRYQTVTNAMGRVTGLESPGETGGWNSAAGRNLAMGPFKEPQDCAKSKTLHIKHLQGKLRGAAATPIQRRLRCMVKLRRKQWPCEWSSLRVEHMQRPPVFGHPPPLGQHLKNSSFKLLHVVVTNSCEQPQASQAEAAVAMF